MVLHSPTARSANDCVTPRTVWGVTARLQRPAVVRLVVFTYRPIITIDWPNNAAPSWQPRGNTGAWAVQRMHHMACVWCIAAR